MAVKRTKKYNPKKGVNAKNSLEMKKFVKDFGDIGIACNLLDESKSGLFMDGKLPSVSKQNIQHMMFNCRHHWVVYAGVCIIETNGKHKLKVIDLGVSSPVVFKDITQSIQQAHKEFLYTFSGILNRVVGYGFIAYITEKERDDELLMRGFTQIGCFEQNFVAHINEKQEIEFFEKPLIN
ncbi:MAG: hypothetical protein ACRCVV_21840 [Shewanella sp.]